MNRGFASVVLIIAALMIVAAGAGGWWYLKQPRITASPMSGPAPLTVTFSISRDIPGLTFDFGEQNQRQDTVAGGYAHTYTKAGMYVAAVKKFPRCSSWECYGVPETIQTFTITVTEPLVPTQQNTNTGAQPVVSNQPTQTYTPPKITTAQPGGTVSAWQTYRSSYGFEIQYPPAWKIVNEAGDGKAGYPGWVVSFGTGTFGNQGYDGELFVFAYDKSSTNIEQYIKDMGKQFTDRQEKRENITINGVPALKVVVTTHSISTWDYEAVIVEQQNRFYVMHNGAVKRDSFTDFYKSFKIVAGATQTIPILYTFNGRTDDRDPGAFRLQKGAAILGAGYFSFRNVTEAQVAQQLGIDTNTPFGVICNLPVEGWSAEAVIEITNPQLDMSYYGNGSPFAVVDLVSVISHTQPQHSCVTF